MKRRFFVLLLLGLSVVLAFSSGTQQSSTGVGEGISFNIWSDDFTAWDANVMESFEDHWVYQQMEEKTGIDIIWTHSAVGEGAEQFNLLIASGDLPDIIIRGSNMLDGGYPGGADKMIEDGVALRLNELVEKHGQDYLKALAKLPELVKFSKTDSGNMYAFHMIQVNPQPPFLGPVVRKDWLDDLGLDVPTTLADWTTMLRAFRDQKDAEAPLAGIPATGIEMADLWNTGMFSSAFGVVGTFIQQNGKIKYGPMEPGYAEYVKFMNGWYEEGLINQDFPSGYNSDEYWREEKAGAMQYGFWQFDTVTKAARDEDGIANFELVGVPLPKQNENDTLHLGQKVYNNLGRPGIITPENHNPEKAVAWFNEFYTDEMHIMMNYGIEGEDFVYVDGKPEFTDKRKYADDLPFTSIWQKYSIHHIPGIREWSLGNWTYGKNGVGACDIWDQSVEYDAVVPPLTFSSEEGRRRAAIMTDITTYVGEMTPKFIMGIEPLSKVDEFVNQLEAMGIEEAIEITQAALDRFNKR